MDLNREIIACLEDDLLYEHFGTIAIVSVISRSSLVHSLAVRGEFAEGITRGEEGVRIAETADHPESLVRIYGTVGDLHLCQGDLPKAIPMLQRGLEICRVANIPVIFPTICSSLGYAYALSGRITEALPIARQDRQNKPVLSCPRRSRCTKRWRWSSGCPRRKLR
jgi:hypothetical protein